MKSSSLNIYKLSSRVKSFEDVLLPSRGRPFEVESEKLVGNFQYKLFIQRNNITPPQWSSLLAPVLIKREIFNSNSSFVLLMRVNKNEEFFFFALIGGHTAYSFISKYIEDSFGLKIAERTIDPKKIKHLTQTSFTGSDRQVIRAVQMYNPFYDLENQRRILKALEGKALSADLMGLSVSGADSLRVKKRITFDELKNYLEEIIDIYLSKEEGIRWPKNFSIIKDEDLIYELEGVLIENLLKLYHPKDYDFEEISESFLIGYKNFFDLYRCSIFSISYKNYEDEFTNLDIESIISFLKNNDLKINIFMLKDIKIRGLDEDGFEIIPESSLSLFLYAEIQNDNTYFYIDGYWHLLHGSYKKYVDNALANIPLMDNNYLPTYIKNLFPLEKSYNKWVPTQNSDFIFLDSKLIDKIEVCDLFKKNYKHFVHVKKGWGAKLSHLFSQGLVSAVNFHSDSNFRNKCHALSNYIGVNQKNNDYSVIFAIVHPKTQEKDFPQNMTYFSKVNLIEVVEKINQSGYNMMLAPVNFI